MLDQDIVSSIAMMTKSRERHVVQRMRFMTMGESKSKGVTVLLSRQLSTNLLVPKTRVISCPK